MTTRASARTAARERAAAERAEAVRRRRLTRRALIGAGVVGVLLVAGGVIAFVESGVAASADAATRSGDAVRAADAAAARTAADGRTTPAPWTLPTDAEASVRSAGLSMLSTEGTALHIHQHLSITIDGRQARVPALLGIDEATQRLSALHTHDTSGILHVESPVVRTFHLDQAFAEWDVRLGTGAIGSYVDGRDGVRLAVFVDGRRYRGDPRGIVLKEHEDIDFVVTTDGSTPRAPAAFTWPSGY